MENNTKTVECCIKIFRLLKLLLEDNATFDNTMRVITENEPPFSSENSINSVTLNKYLNTLKLFGLNIHKEKGKFYLINPPYKINLTPEELRAFQRIKNSSNLFGDNDENLDFHNFLHSLEMRFSEQTKAYDNSCCSDIEYRFYYETFTDKVRICSKFCREDYYVEIIYKDRNKEHRLIGTAYEIIFRTRTAKLQVLDQATKDIKSISIDRIMSIKQLHSKVQTTYSAGRVTVFGLKGRLAKNYKLRTWETSSGFENGWLIITNRGESEEDLTERILKYGDLCKVFTPHSYRDKIKSEIDRTLALYEN